MNVERERCVHLRTRDATCRACVDACPEGAFSFGGVLDPAKCTRCGVCQGACPTRAISVFTPDLRGPLACGSTAPCLAALSVEEWVAIGLERPLDPSACDRCPSTAVLGARVAEARGVLATLGRPAPAPVDAPAPAEPGWLLAWAAASEPGPRALDPARVRAREVPPTRAAWVGASTGCDGAVHATFTSGKALDPSTCTVCLRCVNSCPTGALTATRRRDELRFDAGACVRCGVCHDVCEPRAITLADPIRLGALVEGPVTLGRIEVRRCLECGEPFPARTGSARCARCDDLDDEARALVAGPRRTP